LAKVGSSTERVDYPQDDGGMNGNHDQPTSITEEDVLMS